ncbi:alpha/beta hydrolase [Flavobacterium sp. MC2016-06]|jgi:pimeloyl-ACP methyl ester carboxylesterase|uniref:alpha/beta fold hydrolase n=1 Tax=Flavobacterium sp. MC2016-06 TaxID=2676308 RepID=UPI0012BAF961|nr:alpha/beta hydrolase [Flavobacterium sp. MC2016-06]MBU3858473.1 alpha/beta hydrolase [Flavobacterium sp. MC2016-06]
MIDTNEGKLLDICGNKLYVEHHNNFENHATLVFLHDSLGCTALWRDFPIRIAELVECNLLIYDRLGYGKSDPILTYERANDYLEDEAAILNELLQTLKIDNAILFGHSDGGSIALIAASKYGTRVEKIICEAGHIFVEDITLKGIYSAIEMYKTTNLAQRLEKYHGKKTEMIFKAWTETWTRSNYRNWNIEHLLQQISCPLLFIQGEKDEYGTLNQVEKTIEKVSGKAEKLIIPNVGHTPHREAVELVLENVIAFILSEN